MMAQSDLIQRTRTNLTEHRNLGAMFRGESASAVMLEMCSMRVGQTFYGIPITHILEIVGGARLQPVPLAPEFVAGLVHYRGDVLTTVSLRRLLGAGDFYCTSARQDIVVLESPASCFALLVDSVGEVLTVSAADHEPNPSILDEQRRGLFAGAYKMKDCLLVMLDPARLDPDRLDYGSLERGRLRD